MHTKNCECCQKEFHTKYKRQRFCGRSCSNSKVARRKKNISICTFELCDNELEHYSNSYCRSCKDLGRQYMRSTNGYLLTEITIAQYCKRGGANRFDNIRWGARKLIQESELDKKCQVCGYDKHYEVAHIRAISDFPEDTIVSDVNVLDNLALLCPNCHWEFDNGQLLL